MKDRHEGRIVSGEWCHWRCKSHDWVLFQNKGISVLKWQLLQVNFYIYMSQGIVIKLCWIPGTDISFIGSFILRFIIINKTYMYEHNHTHSYTTHTWYLRVQVYLENLHKMKQKKLTLNIFRYFNYMVNLYGKLTRYLETVTLQNKWISCTQVHFPVSTRRVKVIRLGNLQNICYL